MADFIFAFKRYSARLIVKCFRGMDMLIRLKEPKINQSVSTYNKDALFLPQDDMRKILDDLERQVALSSHLRDKGEEMVRYYGFYSNVSLGAGEGRRTRMDWCLASCSSRNHPKSTARIGRGLYRKYTRRIP